MRAQGYELGEYINPDDIAAGLLGAYDARVRQARELADLRRAQAIASRRSFSFETVFSHSKSWTKPVEPVSRSILFFVAVDDPSINIERVKTRVSLGGHDVPIDRISNRYRRTMELLPEMVERADRTWIFDNTAQYADRASFAGQLVAVVDAGIDGPLTLEVRSSLPSWVVRHLIAPARARGWKITFADEK